MIANRRVKFFCFFCVNIGVVGWSIIFLLEGATIQRGMFVFFTTLVLMNLLIWFLFRAKEKGESK
jgi:hypothetical protein